MSALALDFHIKTNTGFYKHKQLVGSTTKRSYAETLQEQILKRFMTMPNLSSLIGTFPRLRRKSNPTDKISVFLGLPPSGLVVQRLASVTLLCI
jgi:hypothetical protein